ncbi:MAG: ATP-binding cassette domain-containing protein [Clostridiales bacterium]
MKSLYIENLCKKYGSKSILNSIKLTIHPGIFGLLGPNGAGKTTLMKCIVSLIDNYDGKIKYGEKLWSRFPGKNGILGYVPQKFSLFKELTIKEGMEYISIMKGEKNYINEIDNILSSVNLVEEKNKKIKNLSGGMLRRLGIAQALIGNPKILIVDEPTAGLDPEERVRFRNILMKLPKDKIIIISSHIVEDLDLIANRLSILKDGKSIICDTIENVIARVEGKVYKKIIDLKDIYSYESTYRITSVTKSGDKALIRIISEKSPENFQKIHPILEDAYFYLLGNYNENI